MGGEVVDARQHHRRRVDPKAIGHNGYHLKEAACDAYASRDKDTPIAYSKNPDNPSEADPEPRSTSLNRNSHGNEP